MKMWLALINILLVTASGAGQKNYYQMDAGKFFALEEANSPIELENFDRHLMEAAIFYATNEVRQEQEKSTFKNDTVLNRASRFHATYLAKTREVDHLNRKQKKYKTPYDRAKVFGGDFSALSENLARVPIYKLGHNGEFFIDDQGRLVNEDHQVLETFTYAGLARHILDGWMNSEGHRENILKDFSLLGIGVTQITYNQNGIPELYLVQNFANP